MKKATKRAKTVVRYVVQESTPNSIRGWYDDPDIPESLTLKRAVAKHKADCQTSPEHSDFYLHRIIKRTERVMVSL